jgi:hypothetical protein
MQLLRLQRGRQCAVTVNAAAQGIATDEARISETLHQRLVAGLPISGRNVWSLAGTTPGVLSGSSSFTGAGQRNIQNSISLDGIGASQNLLTSTTMRPSVDSVNEVQVQTGSASAEYGAYLGVRMNVITNNTPFPGPGDVNARPNQILR